MNSSAAVLPFADCLRERVAKLDPPLTQAQLADKAGVDRSVISRILQGERLPTNEVLRRLAPALDVDVENLVRGTDAESRLEEGGKEALTVRHSVHMELLRKNTELEGAERELQEKLRGEVDRRKLAESAASQAYHQQEEMRRDLATAVATIKNQEQNQRDLKESESHYKRMFSDALTQLRGLNAQTNELKDLLNSTSDEVAAARKSGRLGNILSGIAAVTSAATFAYYVSRDSSGDQSEQKTKVKSKTTKERRHKS